MRKLAILAGALALGATSAEAASAATISAKLSVKGAGSVLTPFVSPREPGRTCTQKEPVSDSVVLICPNNPWTKTSKSGPVTMTITAAKADGWKFAGWTGCPSGDAVPTCTITQLSGLRNVDLTARFEDSTMPATVPGLKIVPTGSEQPSHRAEWDSSEAGLRWQCAIDGGPRRDCSPGMALDLPEGEHRVSVGAIDPSGNSSALVSAFYTVVETKLRSAPVDGSTVAAANFVADSSTATDYDCSIDGGTFAACGRAPSGGLTLPALSDGRHTVAVRGRAGQWVDPSPASRTFTLDTTAPRTTLTKVGDMMDFRADEPAGFRCSLDGATSNVCASRYPLPDLAPGRHAFEVYAIDRVGNREQPAARVEFDVAMPVPVPTVTPVPTPTRAPDPNASTAPVTGGPAPAGPAAPVAPAGPVAPAILAPAAKQQAFKVTYRYRKGRLTKLRVAGIPAGQKLTVKIKCPKRAKTCPKSPTTVRKLVGKRLAKGTRITFTAGKAAKTIRL
jgi:hypothetical protein